MTPVKSVWITCKVPTSRLPPVRDLQYNQQGRPAVTWLIRSNPGSCRATSDTCEANWIKIAGQTDQSSTHVSNLSTRREHQVPLINLHTFQGSVDRLLACISICVPPTRVSGAIRPIYFQYTLNCLRTITLLCGIFSAGPLLITKVSQKGMRQHYFCTSTCPCQAARRIHVQVAALSYINTTRLTRSCARLIVPMINSLVRAGSQRPGWLTRDP